MKHFLGRIWNPVFSVIDLKKATILIKDGATGTLVGIAGGAAEWTQGTLSTTEWFYTGSETPTEPVVVMVNDVDITGQEGTVGALTVGQWGWGDENSEHGSDTLRVYLEGFPDPDDYSADYIQIALAETANEIEVKIGEGNLSYTRARTIEYVLDRGNLDEVREGDQVPLDVSFDFQWEYISGLPASAIPTIEEALANEGEASTWVSSDQGAGAACRPYAVDIEITYLPTPSTCGDQEIITFTHFRYESLDHDLRAGTVSVSGKCNILKPTAVRSAQ
jgi:hypothetical protein